MLEFVLTKINDKSELVGDEEEIIFLGDRIHELEQILEGFKNKTKSKIPQYLEEFIKLLKRTENPSECAHLFRTKEDYSNFKITYFFNTIKYFMENLNIITESESFQFLFDIITKCEPEISRGQKTIIIKEMENALASIDPFLISKENLKNSISYALDGFIIDQPIPRSNLIQISNEENGWSYLSILINANSF